MPSVVRSGTQDEGQAGADPGTLDKGQAGSDPGTLDEGQAGSDPGTLDEGQTGSNPDDVTESLPLPTPSVLAGPNLEHSNVEITDPSSQPQPEHMDEGFTASAYPDGHLSTLQHLAKDFSFGDQFLNDKPSEADNEKTTADTEAESMVSVTIQQDTSIIPPMTSPVIDLVSRPDSPNVHWPLPTTTTTTAAPTTTTTTTTLPLPPQPQQGSSDSILIKRIGELEQHIVNLVEENQALETRLTKQGSRINKLESVDVSKMIREQTVEFIDSQEIDRKINESVRRWLAYLSKAGASGASGTTGASDSAQAPPPPPPSSSTHQGDQSTGTAAPSSSKIAASAEYSAWTMTDTQIKPSITLIYDDLYMDDEITADEQAVSSDDEVRYGRVPKLLTDQVDDVSLVTTSANLFLWEVNLALDLKLWLSDTGSDDFQLGMRVPDSVNLSKPRWVAMDFEFMHDYTVIDSPKGKKAEDMTYLSESGELCGWTDPRRRLPEILLKMNLPDHRSVLTDSEDQAKMEMETPRSGGVNSPPNAHT
ncbi:hypothetical protein Tco_0976976 [Tanacetum coccineum]|uniref:SUN domain-containing protein n=1 Tax=Tanacetum coccineum TaxID=301880 RepID=A0ABQ5EIV5_9ASTR